MNDIFHRGFVSWSKIKPVLLLVLFESAAFQRRVCISVCSESLFEVVILNNDPVTRA